jgi:LacI family transcriptional regulator
MSSRVTLEQVARTAGVSVSTASRALNGKARQFRISSRTEQSVICVAGQLGFQPSYVARSLRTKRSSLIGVLVPDVSNPFFAAIAREATLCAEEHGMSVLLADSREEVAIEQQLIQKLKLQQVEGLIVCPVGVRNQRPWTASAWKSRVVLVDRWLPNAELTSVTSDNEEGAFAATMALIQRGHRQVGCLQGRPGASTNDERVRGFARALREIGVKVRAEHVQGDDFSESSGYASCHALMDRCAGMTAMLALGNQIALGALRALRERGLGVANQISLITFDDVPFADFLASPLSVVRQNERALGRLAAELLIHQIQTGRQVRKRVHRVGVELVLRSSIAQPTGPTN